MSGTERIVDVDIAEFSQIFAEFSDILWASFDFCAVLVFDGAFFFDVEAEVFEQDDGAVRGSVDGVFNFEADGVVDEDDILFELFFELFCDGLERIFCDDLAIGTSEM